MDRPWQQQQAPPYSPTDRASPHSQPGWFPLQEAQAQTGWTQEDTTSTPYDPNTSQHQRQYASSSMYSPAPTPPYVWTGELHTPRMNPYMTAPYPRPVGSPLGSGYERPREPELKTERRGNKDNAIGRWNSEEHRLFLEGLETFQGPAWGEIARLIGTRTSTQVRTHAQKFFTKMARLNQSLPFFETQIQKERARLVAQGASVTPTAQSGPSSSLATTLSPRKRLASAGSNSPRQTLERFKEVNAASPTCPPMRFTTESYDAKPRIYTGPADAAAVGYGSTATSPSNAGSVTKEWTQWTEDGRQWPQTSPTSTSASLVPTQTPVDDGGHSAGNVDSDSLPSMDKLLYRSAAA